MMGGDEAPSPILVAAAEGNCAEISRLVKAGVCGVDDDEGVGPGSTTALCIACDRGYTDVVSLLISLGADVSRGFGASGSTAAHFAARNGHVEVLKLLQLAGAKLLSQNKAGDTILLHACASGRASVVEWTRSGEDTRLHALASTPNKLGMTPAMVASAGGHAACLEALLSSSLDLNLGCSDDRGNTALHHAVQAGSAACIRAILGSAPPPPVPNRAGKSPLGIAQAKAEVGEPGGMEVVGMLEEWEAELESRAMAAAQSLFAEEEEEEGDKGGGGKKKKKKKNGKSGRVNTASLQAQVGVEGKREADDEVLDERQPQRQAGTATPPRLAASAVQRPAAAPPGDCGEEEHDGGHWDIAGVKSKSQKQPLARRKPTSKGPRGSPAADKPPSQNACNSQGRTPGMVASPTQRTSAQTSPEEGASPLLGAWASMIRIEAEAPARGQSQGVADDAGDDGQDDDLPALERRVRERFPLASSLAIEPRHLCGLDTRQLSASQVEALCEVHHVLLAEAEEMRVEIAVMQERSRMEMLMEEELRIQAAILRNP